MAISPTRPFRRFSPSWGWFKRLLVVRLVAEAGFGCAWLLAPAMAWTVLTLSRGPLEGSVLDAVTLMRAGGVLPVGFALMALLVVLAARPLAGLAALTVAMSWCTMLVRWWLLRPLLEGSVGAGLATIDLACNLVLTVLLHLGLPRGERFGLTELFSGLAALGIRLAQGFASWRRPGVGIPVLGAALVALWAGWVAWAHLRRPAPEPMFANDVEHFKYAPVGNTRSQGLPWYVWEVLPEVFADKLPRPGGYEVFGLLFEAEHSLPVGAALRTNGLPIVSFNCALCHSGSYRTNVAAPTQIVVGAPAIRLDFDAFVRFLTACGGDPRFTSATLLPRIEARHPLTATERFVYRHVVIPVTRIALQAVGQQFTWVNLRPPSGAGRVDAINILKQVLLRMPDDGSIGTTDYLFLWNQRSAARQLRGWNGGGSVHAANLLAAGFFLGFDPRTFAEGNFERTERFLQDLRPPPFPGGVDAELAARGRTVFGTHCADCHSAGGNRTGKLTPATEVGTDAHYLHAWRQEAVDWLRALKRGPFAYPDFTRTDGFANLPLDGLWLRAPYLHNGSIPTLRDLLQAPDERPRVFVRGSDVLDFENVGFVSGGPEAERTGSRLDTRLLGNANDGHTYGTELNEVDKRALLEYLKTL